MNEKDKLIYNNKEASKALGVSIRTLYTLRTTGRIKSFKFGNRNYFRKEDLIEFIENQIKKC